MFLSRCQRNVAKIYLSFLQYVSAFNSSRTVERMFLKLYTINFVTTEALTAVTIQISCVSQ
jgi:hypothetical protein